MSAFVVRNEKVVTLRAVLPKAAPAYTFSFYSLLYYSLMLLHLTGKKSKKQLQVIY